MHNTADDAAVVHPFLAPHIGRQIWFNPLPLRVAQPEKILAHVSDPSRKRITIVLSARKD
jgi:hypothetical protein